MCKYSSTSCPILRIRFGIASEHSSNQHTRAFLGRSYSFSSSEFYYMSSIPNGIIYNTLHKCIIFHPSKAIRRRTGEKNRLCAQLLFCKQHVPIIRRY